MTVHKLIKVLPFGSGNSRLSGNGSFKKPKKKDIGREVIVERTCVTWNGCLGYFKDDKKKQTYAFYIEELNRIIMD